MGATPPIPEPLWGCIPPDVQAALAAAFDRIERRVAELEQRIGRNSTNSSTPPSLPRPALAEATTTDARLGQEAGRPARTSASRPPAGPARGGPPGHRVQAASMPLVRRRPRR